MADSVDYVFDCACGETIYASGSIVSLSPTVVKVQYWPEIEWPDCHDPITHCRKCERDLKRVEDEIYDDAMDQIP